MFTGIVEDVGDVLFVERKSGDAVFRIGVDKIPAAQIVRGESIAVNGVCLTAVAVGEKDFSAEASRETLSRTSLSGLRAGDGVNLERSIRAGDRMGGHIVTGHVDGVGTVGSRAPVGESVVFSFSIPRELSRYVVEKGSIAVDGVSLTVNSAGGEEFSVNIIPHTLRETIFSGLRAGAKVNLECDIIGKYVERLLFAEDGSRRGSSARTRTPG